MNLLIRFDSTITRDSVGGKGANLARLIDRGFQVPEARGVVVDAFDMHVTACREAGATDDTALRQAILSRPLDEDLAGPLRAFVEQVGGRVSVRSSATLEDAHTHSFAGQFLTVLNVGADGVADAVRHVWASAYGDNVRAYLERGGLDGSALQMAAVVQQQIDSTASGVVLGDGNRAMIESVFGQGEAVVSAEVESDHWDLQNGRIVAARTAHKGWRVGIPDGAPTGALERIELPEDLRDRSSLRPDQVLEVAALAGRLAASFDDRPQDCEFSFVDDELFVLQTRDVTASLPIEAPELGPWEAPGEGPWELDESHFTRPVTRLFADLFPEAMMRGFRAASARYGALLSHVEIGVTNRFMFMGIRPVMDPDEAGKRMATAAQTWKNREWRQQAAEWESDKCASIEAHLALQGVQLASLSDAALIEHLHATVAHAQRMVTQHHTYNLASFVPTGDLMAHAERWSAGKITHAEILELLAGTSAVSADLRSPDARRLARSVAGSPEARALLRLEEAAAGASANGVQVTDIEAAQALEALRGLEDDAGRHAGVFLDHREYRLVEGLDPSSPCLREEPALLWRAVRDAARFADDETSEDGDREALLQRCREAIPAEHREAFAGLLEEARSTYHIRDERALYSDVWAWGILRSVCLEIGARLLRREDPLVVEPEDALQAGVDELVSLLLEGTGPSVAELLARDLYQRSYTTDVAPAALGPEPPPPPPLDELPPDQARLMGGLMTVIGLALAGRGEKPAEGARELIGRPASGGVFEGPAHVIASPGDVANMAPGSVLVVGASSSAFTMLAPLAAAVIAEGGGLLSHVAIVCREYRIPCVVGCAGVLERVTTGQRVRVDGTHGTVALLEGVVTETEDREHVPGSLVAALMLTAMLTPLNSTMIAVALPAIATRFGVAGGAATTWLVTSYLIVNIALVGPAGKLGDLIGRRAALRLGQGVFAAGAIAGGLSPVLSGVVAGRVLMAAGGAIVVPAVMAALRGAFAPERRARWFATMGSLMGVAAAVGPLLGGILTARAGWQSIFLVNAPVLLLTAFLARDASSAEERSAIPAGGGGWRRLDLVGVGLLVSSLGALAAGSKIAALRWGLVPAGVIGLTAFVLWERRADEPLIDLAMLRNRTFVAGGVVVALQNLSMYALLFQLPFLFAGPLDVDPERGGRILLVMMATMVVTAPLGGFLSERIGVRTTVIVGLLGGGSGLFFGLRGIAQGSVGLLVACLAAMGLGVGFVMGPNQAAALSAVSAGRSGMASGLLATLRYVGGLAGVTLIALLLNGADGPVDLGAHRVCLWVYVGAHVAALAVAAGLPKRVRAFTRESSQPVER